MKTLKELLETHQLKVGDHFRWQYDETKEGGSYWCKSQMCIWDGKNFKDLFWSMGTDSESYTLPEDCVLLSFMGNINDYEECNVPFCCYGKAVTGFEPVIEVLQTCALPLGYTAEVLLF